jgi:hypothetical protein
LSRSFHSLGRIVVVGSGCGSFHGVPLNLGEESTLEGCKWSICGWSVVVFDAFAVFEVAAMIWVAL